MRVGEELAHVVEEGRRRMECWSAGVLECWSGQLGLVGPGGRLLKLIHAVWKEVGPRANPSITPGDLQGKSITRGSGGEHPHRIVAGKIPSAGNHFLGLRRDRAAGDRDFGPDAPGI